MLVEKENTKRRARGLSTPPTCPSISTLVIGPHGNDLLCPVRAYTIYHRRTAGAGFSKNFLWDHGTHKEKVNVQGLACKFAKLVRYAKTNAGIHNADPVGPHQCRKLAASYGSLLCHRLKDEVRLRVRMGFSSLSDLRRGYIQNVSPPLSHAVVFPGGTYTSGKSRNTYYRANKRARRRGQGRCS